MNIVEAMNANKIDRVRVVGSPHIFLEGELRERRLGIEAIMAEWEVYNGKERFEFTAKADAAGSIEGDLSSEGIITMDAYCLRGREWKVTIEEV